MRNVQLALEILTGVCATLPDPEPVAEDDEEEEVDELLSERAEDEHDDEIDSDDERSHRTLFPRNSEPVRNDAGQKRHLRAGAVARASSFHPLPGTEAARVSRSRR